jgi:hypothetical protein
MSAVSSKGSRKWHPDQERLLFECLIRPEFKPIGGDGDGVMERKVEARWMPLLEYFEKENGKLAERLSTACGLRPKLDFDVKILQRKWQTFKELYARLKKECRVGRHQQQGETGAAAEGQPATAQAAIDSATKRWHLFGEFHSAFGEVQRLRDDTFEETLSPYKPPAAGDGEPQAAALQPEEEALAAVFPAMARSRRVAAGRVPSPQLVLPHGELSEV